MEKGTRRFKCPSAMCSVTIRISISTLQYGKTLEGKCPKCGAPWETTIPVPAPEPPVMQSSGPSPFSGAFADIFGDMLNPKR